MGGREDEAAEVRILSVERAWTRGYGGFLFFFFLPFLLRRPKVTRVTRVALEGCARRKGKLPFLPPVAAELPADCFRKLDEP